MRHNNVLPNAHFRKDWQRRVRTWFNQAPQKSARRRLRAAKAARVAPRPVDGLLRPVVHCPTFKYNMKVRAGRGFSLLELKQAGISSKLARTVGISVDHRRRNRSAESLQINVERLKAYQAKLVVLPRNAKHPKKADTSVADFNAAKVVSRVADAFPITNSKNALVEVRKIADAEKTFPAYATLRKAQSDAKYAGVRAKRAAQKAAEEAEKAK